MDRNSFTYGSVTMQPHDIRLLSGNFWLNDQCLSFYLEYLARKYPIPRVILLEPSTSFLIALEDDPEDLKAGLNRLDLATPDLIFLPINDNTDPGATGGSHWTLLVLSKRSWTGYHYNSMGTGGNNLYQAHLIAQKLATVLDSPQIVEIREIELRPGQGNSYDCGVYVLGIAEILLQDLQNEQNMQENRLCAGPFTRLTNEQIRLKRREMYRLAQEIMRV